MDRWEIEFLKAMRGLTILYNRACTEELLGIYRMVLKPLSVEELIKAVEIWVNDSKNVFFPLPAQLKVLVQPERDTEGEAGLIADRMWAACSYGTDIVGTERAKNFIGEFGWAVVQNAGSWDTFNRSVTDMEQAPSLKAQWRRSVFEMMQKKKIGLPLVVHKLKDSSEELKSLGVIMKSIEGN